MMEVVGTSLKDTMTVNATATLVGNGLGFVGLSATPDHHDSTALASTSTVGIEAGHRLERLALRA